jgi:hypothetical protein
MDENETSHGQMFDQNKNNKPYYPKHKRDFETKATLATFSLITDSHSELFILLLPQLRDTNASLYTRTNFF